MSRLSHFRPTLIGFVVFGLGPASLGVEIVLSGSTVPADQGWSISTNQGQPDVSTDGSLLTFNTIGTPEGATPRLIYHKDVGIGGSRYWVEVRLKVNAIEANHENLEAGLAFYTTFDPAFPGGKETDRQQMVWFDPGAISFGSFTSSAAMDTTDAIHTYRFEKSGSSLRVYVDGQFKLSRGSPEANGVIAFGDMSELNGLNSNFTLESILVFRDCNGNGVEDSIDLAQGSPDCDLNGNPDSCDLVTSDCDGNGTPDACDIASGVDDCDINAIPDECETTGFDCNGNQTLDSCDVGSGLSQDADGNGYPDECALGNPPPVGPDPTGFEKSRFISFLNPTQPVGATAIRIRLISLHHVDPPYTGGPSVPFALFEGQSVWVGPPGHYVESILSGTPFIAAQTQCTPHYRDWTTVGLLHVTGAHITPSSIFRVEQVPIACRVQEDACTWVSPQLEIKTCRWGDVQIPFNPPSNTVQPDVADIAALTKKFREDPMTKARLLLMGQNSNGVINTATLANDLNFSHVAACVDAFRGVPYPFKMGKCATGPGVCTADLDCSGASAPPCNMYCPQ